MKRLIRYEKVDKNTWRDDLDGGFFKYWCDFGQGEDGPYYANGNEIKIMVKWEDVKRAMGYREDLIKIVENYAEMVREKAYSDGQNSMYED